MKVLKPLNLIEYNKEEAKKELIDKLDTRIMEETSGVSLYKVVSIILFG